MKGLYKEVETALKITISGLNYDFLKGDEISNIDPERMKSIAKSKLESLAGAKKIIDSWIDSPNKPSDKKIIDYVEQIVNAGDTSIKVLRRALEADIDFSDLEPHKHAAAISAKPVIFESIIDIDKELRELRDKLDTGDISFKEREFDLGFPERFAKGEFYPQSDYHKNKLTENGGVIIDPKSTIGETIIIDDLEIILPKVPRHKSKILFSDLPKKEQYWRRTELPEITTNNIEQYESYILEEFRRRREGIWFMNNGKPTYLTGHHYFALQFCKMLDSGGYMNYREAQKNLFYFIEACLVDPRSLGILFGKSRRTGFTYSAIAVEMNRATSTNNTKHGLMSKSGVDGSEAFSKISYMFLNLPFWFRPIVRGKLDSPKELFFGKPSDNSKKTKKSKNIQISDYLNTSMDWRNTKNGSYDSIKLDTYILDEVFKIEAPNNVITHLGMVSPTMMPNGRVVGKMLAGSTMGKHNKGGLEGIQLIEGSKVADRDPVTNKTATGLYFHYLPAHKNMEEFTDIYGKCWDKKPTKKVLNVFGDVIDMGAEDYLIAIETQKKKQGDTAYNEQIRTYPRTLEHMLRDEATECVFNMTKLTTQIDYNNTLEEEQKYIVGNFEWTDGIKDTEVIFYPNPKGRFKVAWLPSVVDDTKGLANAVGKKGDSFFPLNKDCVRFGCDPFSIKSTHGEGSKGGLHGKTIMFPEGGAPSNKFVVEYIARPSDETVFFEDVIKCIRYYGSPILVESNRIDLLRHMRNRGYRKFAIDRLDRPTSKLSAHEKEYGGQPMSSPDIIDSHINVIGAWVEKYVGESTNDEIRPIGEMGEIPFNETLTDWLKFDPDKRTKFDATISSGLAIMACQTEKYKGVKKERKIIKLNSFIKKYNNKGNVSNQIRQ